MGETSGVRGHGDTVWSSLFLAGLLGLFLLSAMDARAEGVPAAEVASVHGQGSYRLDRDQAWQKAMVAQELFPANEVRTGELSRMGLLFSDRTQIRLHEKTHLLIKQPVGDDSGPVGNRLKLNLGRAWTRSKALPRGLVIETPAATAAIRGTSWELSVDQEGTTLLSVVTGEVEFYNDYGRLTVGASEQARAEKGKPPVKVMLVTPKERVQWVTAHQVDPLRHFSFISADPALLRARFRESGPEEGPLARAMLLADLGQWDEAGATFDKATDPILADLGQAYCALHRGDPAEAGMLLGRVRSGAGMPQEHARFLLEYAEISLLVLKEDLAPALARLDNLIVAAPQQSAPYLLRADLEVFSGKLDQALALLAEAGERFPDDGRIPALAGSILLLRDQGAAAEEALAAAAGKGQGSYESLLLEGNLARLDGDARGALAAYSRAREKKPGDDRAWYGLGRVHTEREDVRPARESLERALELNPVGSGYQGELGTLETFANRFAAAEAAFARALADNPDDYVAHTGLGILRLKQGQPEEALDSFLRAGLLEPRYARAHLYAGVAYYQMEMVDQALTEIGLAAELDPKDPLPHMLASMIHMDFFEAGQAVEEARQAKQLMPYLKSLNQIANDQQGTANLGRAFNFFLLNDWAQSYAQESYYPFWAGSHFFLSGRYPGDFNKSSELYQGYLADPTVFGTGERFQPLITRPGHHVSTYYFVLQNDWYRYTSPYVQVNGLGHSAVPLAYSLGFRNMDVASREEGLYGYTLDHDVNAALGARLSDNFGLFTYNNFKRYSGDDLVESDGTTISIDNGKVSTLRSDLGVHLKFAPTNQLWVKLGRTQEDFDYEDMVHDEENTLFNNLDASLLTDAEEYDFQIRQIVQLGSTTELSWGMESARERYSGKYEVAFLFDTTIEQVQDTLSRNRDFYLSGRFQATPQLLLQSDLFFQEYDRLFQESSDWVINQNLSYNLESSDLSVDHDDINPRLGLVWDFGENRLLRLAYQDWRRPVASNSLGPVATAGIPLEDRLVARGGEIERGRAQLEWEWSASTFTSVFAEYARVQNEDAVSDLTDDFGFSGSADLNQLLGLTSILYADDDLLEEDPDFGAGKVTRAGANLNRILTDALSLYARYQYAESKNSGTDYEGLELPYLPRHTLAVGSNWISPQKIVVVPEATFRSSRFADEANDIYLEPGWSLALDVVWESRDKHWLAGVWMDYVLEPNYSKEYGALVSYRY